MNFFYSFLLKLLLKWSWALTHAEKSQLGMEFRAALTGSSGTSKCLPVEPPAAGIIPQLSFSLATWMAGCKVTIVGSPVSHPASARPAGIAPGEPVFSVLLFSEHHTFCQPFLFSPSHSQQKSIKYYILSALSG